MSLSRRIMVPAMLGAATLVPIAIHAAAASPSEAMRFSHEVVVDNQRDGFEPDIQVVDVNLAGDRKLIVQHRATNRILLEEKDARMVLQHIADLWGYDVVMSEVDPDTDAVLKDHKAQPRPGIVPLEG